MALSLPDKLLGDFFLVSGMEISLLNSDQHSIAFRKCPHRNFCSYFHRSPKGLDCCRASDAERLAEAKRTAAPLLYTCPAGITEYILPILKDGQAEGYLFSALGICSEEFTDDQILARVLSIAPELSPEELSEQIAALRHMTVAERNAFCGMMELLGYYIGQNELLPDGIQTVGALAKRYIRSNLDGKLTLDSIALSLHCSTVTLTQHFKAEFGMTVIEYVTKKRMALAESLLLSSDAPLHKIAEAVGFSDVEYFSRTFKRHHGLPPGAWRKKHQ